LSTSAGGASLEPQVAPRRKKKTSAASGDRRLGHQRSNSSDSIQQEKCFVELGELSSSDKIGRQHIHDAAAFGTVWIRSSMFNIGLAE
jgi:hypothetical protein